jgi:4-aminobutyrate aminotransferase/(S)-3-amino-2-methylpropionate transaminase
MQQLRFDPKRLGRIPGPRSPALVERRDRLVPRGIFNYHPVFIRRGQGALMEDVDGNVLIDFAGGIGCLNVGSSPEEVVAAVQEQADRFLFSCFHVAMHEPYIALVEKLVGYLSGKGPQKGMLANSGAEAVENAIKLARTPTLSAFSSRLSSTTTLSSWVSTSSETACDRSSEAH